VMLRKHVDTWRQRREQEPDLALELLVGW